MYIYGCHVQLPDGGAHESTCKFFYYPAVHLIWDARRAFEVEHRLQQRLSVICADTARTFTPIERDSTLFSSIKQPLAFDHITYWDKGPPMPSALNAIDMGEETAQQLEETPGHRLSEFVPTLRIVSNPIATSNPFAIPRWLASLWTDLPSTQSSSDIPFSINATPRFTDIDIHCDCGLSVIALHHPGVRKLWLLWRPNENNVRDFYRSKSECDRIGTHCCEAIGRHLTDGGILLADGTTRIYIPSGYPHKV